MGDGTFQNREDYWDATEDVLATLCGHNMREINEHVALTDPDLNDYAASVTSNLLEYVCAVALLKPNLFCDALKATSIGCDTHEPLDISGLTR